MNELLNSIEEFLKKQEILLLIAYGSRITGNAHKNSDLDIFIVTENQKYISKKIIEGVKVEMHCFPIEEVKTGIMFINASGETYLKSVLKTGKVLKNEYNTFEELCNLLDYQVKRKRKINGIVLEQLEEYVENFIYREEKYKDHYYFLALELIRRLYHVKGNNSIIPTAKVYDLYKDIVVATEQYYLDLPKEEFRERYLSSLTETDRDNQKTNLLTYLREFQNVETKYIPFNQFLSNQEIEQKLITMNNKVQKCKNMIYESHPYANAFYNIIIREMFEFSYNIESDTEKISDLYELAITLKDSEKRMQVLENLFLTLEQNYHLDYDNFYLVLQREI